MAQIRFWNYLADDKTVDISRANTGIFPAGVYRGFDAALAAGMNLTLQHATTGYKYVDKTQAETDWLGHIMTRQGVIIQEDTPKVLPVDTNPSGFTRIDTVIVSHEYEEVEGGAEALYSVIRGTPSGSPVAPSVNDPKTDVVIGYLILPPATTSLDGAGVIFIKTECPPLGDNQNYIFKNRVNSFTKSIQIKSDPGIRIKEVTYTNGSAYTKQTLEIDPTTNHYVLDLDDVDQIGTYDPLAVGVDSVALLIKPKISTIPQDANFENGLSGFCATVRIKGSAGKRLRLVPTSPDPEPLVGDGFYTLKNSIHAARNYMFSSIYIVDFTTGTEEHLFELYFDGDQNFILFPVTALMKRIEKLQTNKSIYYNTLDLVWTSGNLNPGSVAVTLRFIKSASGIIDVSIRVIGTITVTGGWGINITIPEIYKVRIEEVQVGFGVFTSNGDYRRGVTTQDLDVYGYRFDAEGNLNVSVGNDGSSPAGQQVSFQGTLKAIALNDL